jgi:hypothetical protein
MQHRNEHFALAPIAIAILALTAIPAQAQEFKLGGKFDAGYQFKRTAAVDDTSTRSCPSTGCNTTTEALGDGSASTSRITVQAKEDISPTMSAFIDMDLRFTNVNEGTGGLNSNDKKTGGIKTTFGNLLWGTSNIVNLQIADKPYMVNIKDMEIVKFGISKPRSSDLTNRVTEYASPALSIGPIKMLVKASYGFGDNRKAGDNDGAASKGSGDAMSGGYEMTFGNEASFNYHIIKRAAMTYGEVSGVNQRDGMTYAETDLTYKPSWFDGFRVSASLMQEKGYNPNQTTALGYDSTAFKATGLNYVFSYNWAKQWQIGLELARNMDKGSNRNSGRGFMLGGAYWISPNTYFYAALAKSDWERNETLAGGKYDGTKAGFKDSLKRVDERYSRFGIVKEF